MKNIVVKLGYIQRGCRAGQAEARGETGQEMKDWQVYKSSQAVMGRQWVAEEPMAYWRFQTPAEAIRYAQERAVWYRILDDIESGKYENP